MKILKIKDLYDLSLCVFVYRNLNGAPALKIFC